MVFAHILMQVIERGTKPTQKNSDRNGRGVSPSMKSQIEKKVEQWLGEDLDARQQRE